MIILGRMVDDAFSGFALAWLFAWAFRYPTSFTPILSSQRVELGCCQTMFGTGYYFRTREVTSGRRKKAKVS